jgi:hypothetical protein
LMMEEHGGAGSPHPGTQQPLQIVGAICLAASYSTLLQPLLRAPERPDF